MRLIGPVAREKRAQVGPEVAQIGVGDPRERWIGECREVIGAVGTFAVAHGADEIGLGPAADPGNGVRRDIRSVERAKRRFERAAARKGTASFLSSVWQASQPRPARYAAFGVALPRRPIAAPSSRTSTPARSVDHPCQHDFSVRKNQKPASGGLEKRGGYFFSRNVSWQPPQVFPVAASCAFTAASSPLFSRQRAWRLRSQPVLGLLEFGGIRKDGRCAALSHLWCWARSRPGASCSGLEAIARDHGRARILPWAMPQRTPVLPCRTIAAWRCLTNVSGFTENASE